MIVRYLLYLLVNLLVSGINLLFAPVLAQAADNTGWLPSWLRWFQTPGDSLDGSVGWQTKDRWFLVEDRRWKRWVNRVAWLWRSTYSARRRSQATCW